MKHIKEHIKESQEVNESFTFCGFDVTLAMVTWTVLSALAGMGLSCTGRIVNELIGAMHRNKTRDSRNEYLMKLKDLTRGIEFEPSSPVRTVLNNPGVWDSAMIDELKHELYSKMTPEQQKEFDTLVDGYLKKATRMNAIK